MSKKLQTLNPDASQYQCYTRTMNSFNQPNVSCPCNVACYEKSYTSSVTVSTWPSNQYWVGQSCNNMYMKYKTKTMVNCFTKTIT